MSIFVLCDSDMEGIWFVSCLVGIIAEQSLIGMVSVLQHLCLSYQSTECEQKYVVLLRIDQMFCSLFALNELV